MNLEFLLGKFKQRLAEFEKAVQNHNANPDWLEADSLYFCAKRLRFELKWIMRLSKRCPTLQAPCPEEV